MPTISTLLFRLATALAVITAAGCAPKHPPTIRVTGTVKYHGQPLAGAAVSFFTGAGRAASGITDDQGRFQLSTFGPNDGALAGKHTVTITKRVKVASEKVSGAFHVEKGMSHLDPKHPAEVMIANFLPERYGDFQHTSLSADVSAAGRNDFTFELADGADKP